jgi:hypothetical protein
MPPSTTSGHLRRLVLSAASFFLLISGCTTDGEEPSSRDDRRTRGGVAINEFDPSNFSNPTRIDNAYFPLLPGTRWVMEGQAVEKGEKIERRVETVVTDMTKEVNGVPAIVIIDRDFNDGELAEQEIAFFSQDDDGTVWSHGYYSEELEEGKVVEAPVWLAGVNGAKSGIFMLPEPRLGTPPYEQGVPPVDFDLPDYAQVYRTGQRTCVPVACYNDVLVTKESHPDEPGVFQTKFYARGVGNVRVGFVGSKDAERETLQLVTFERLDEDGLVQLRDAVRKFEGRAYKLKSSKDVYARTKPAEPLR